CDSALGHLLLHLLHLPLHLRQLGHHLADVPEVFQRIKHHDTFASAVVFEVSGGSIFTMVAPSSSISVLISGSDSRSFSTSSGVTRIVLEGTVAIAAGILPCAS